MPYLGKRKRQTLRGTRPQKRGRTFRYRATRRRAGFSGYRSMYGRDPVLRNMRSGGLLGIETKFLDTYATAVALTAPADASGGEIQPTGGCTGCLSAPQVGDTASSRDGKKIVIKSLFLQGFIDIDPQATQSTADTPPIIFLALVQDTQTNGVTINSEDVYSNPSSNAALSTQLMRNMSNSSRFKVLATVELQTAMYALANDTGATGGLVQAGLNTPFKMSWKGIMPVNFTTGSSAANVSGVTDNSIHLIGFCSGTTMAPKVNFTCRIRYVG